MFLSITHFMILCNSSTLYFSCEGKDPEISVLVTDLSSVKVVAFENTHNCDVEDNTAYYGNDIVLGWNNEQNNLEQCRRR